MFLDEFIKEGKFVDELLSKKQLSRSNYCTEIIVIKLLPPTNAGRNWFGLILSTLQHCVLSGLLMREWHSIWGCLEQEEREDRQRWVWWNGRTCWQTGWRNERLALVRKVELSESELERMCWYEPWHLFGGLG